MNTLHTMNREFELAIRRFETSSGMARLLQGEWTPERYGSVLREIYHYAKEDPQMQALAAVRFRGSDREQVRAFFKHATSEIGHDRMALDDLAQLGEDTRGVPLARPLSATIALTSFAFHQIDYDNPVGYLGYLYFLEYMPTQRGQRYGECLHQCGVPPTAMSFLQEHVTVDVAHNRLMERYLDALVHDEDDLESVVYAMHVTADLYGAMLTSAVDHAGMADRDGRVSSTERRRMRMAQTSATFAGDDVPEPAMTA